MKKLTSATIKNIENFIEPGLSSRKASQPLGVSHTTVNNIRNQMKERPAASKSGRPQLLTDSEKRYIARLIDRDKAKHAVDVAKVFNKDRDVPVSTQTIRRALRDAGLKAKTKKKKPAISKVNKNKRLKWALEHEQWTEDDWKRVIWSDETKINRFGSDGNRYSWVRTDTSLQPKLIEPTVKFGGGNIMMWGCMTWSGIGAMARIEGKMDGPMFVNILRECLVPTLEACMLLPEFPPYNQLYFQQDNDPKHTSNVAKSFFASQGFKLMQWPPQSPDLNPIEHLWFKIKREIYSYPEPARGIHELWDRVQREWLKIKPEYCQNLIKSMPSRIKAVIAAKGLQTKY